MIALSLRRKSRTPGRTGAPARPSGPAPWVEVMVQFAETPADDAAATRGERYRQRRAAAQRHRQELEAWLDRQGLSGEVTELGEATAFDLLFAKVTPQAAAALQHAPDVVAVTPASDFTH